MPSLSNDILEIKVNTKGAELSSVINKKTGIEYIWQADPAFWGRHAPILFPIVGRLKEDEFKHEGKAYSMKQHGLARNLEFELQESEAAILAQLHASEETRLQYPFDFSFMTAYSLKENILQITHIIINKGDNPMPFSIGGHPAFNVPMGGNGTYEDHEIYFEKEETLDRYLLEGGLYNGKTRNVLEKSQRLPLTREMFDEDALVFHHPESSYVVLRSHLHGHSVRVSLRGFPYLGIWAKPGADFVCIEPWQGLADYTDSNGDLFSKKGSMVLAAGEEHHLTYTMIFD